MKLSQHHHRVQTLVAASVECILELCYSVFARLLRADRSRIRRHLDNSNDERRCKRNAGAEIGSRRWRESGTKHACAAARLHETCGTGIASVEPPPREERATRRCRAVRLGRPSRPLDASARPGSTWAAAFFRPSRRAKHTRRSLPRDPGTGPANRVHNGSAASFGVLQYTGAVLTLRGNRIDHGLRCLRSRSLRLPNFTMIGLCTYPTQSGAVALPDGWVGSLDTSRKRGVGVLPGQSVFCTLLACNVHRSCARRVCERNTLYCMRPDDLCLS